jgi:flagellar biosynthetic protein FliR
MNLVPEIGQILRAAGVRTEPEVFLTVLALAMARLGAAAPFIPFLGGDPVPGVVVAALAALFALVLCPSLSQELTAAPPFSTFLGLLFKELLVGTLIGLFVQIVFSAVEAAGSMIEYVAGLKPQEILAPQTPAASGPLSVLFGQAAIVIYLSAGVHLLLLRAIADSYVVVPLLGPMPSYGPGFRALALEAGRISVGFLVTAVQIAAPVILVLIFLRLGAHLAMRLAFAGAAMDPLQPVGSLATYGVLFLAAGILAEQIVRQASALLVDLRQLVMSLH